MSTTKPVTSSYDHLNEQDKVALEVDFDRLAEIIEAKNYGAIRMLFALARAMQKSQKRQKDYDPLLEGLIKLLDRGHH